MVAKRHYCIPPLSRIDLEATLELVEDMRYFVLHAPRQTGKTSTLLALADKLNATGKFRCLYVNFEPGQTAREGRSDCSACAARPTRRASRGHAGRQLH